MSDRIIDRPLLKQLALIPCVKAGDDSQLREILHPDRDDASIRYSLAHAQVSPGKCTLRHTLDKSELYYVLSGQGTAFLDDSPYPLVPGSALLIPPGCEQWVQNDSSEPLVFLCLVDPPWAENGETIKE
jgi:mannose-6-phosphate isomerase-like protein (cupin superfamily)